MNGKAPAPAGAFLYGTYWKIFCFGDILALETNILEFSRPLQIRWVSSEGIFVRQSVVLPNGYNIFSVGR